MHIKSHKVILFSCAILALLLSGCKKSQKADTQKDSFFSKTQNKFSKNKSAAAQPFELDDNAMKTFALDDHLSKHRSTESGPQAPSESKLFSWEDSAAEESKHLFHTLYFDFDKDVLKPIEHSKLVKNIEQAKKMIKQGKTIVIEGHACHSAGSAIYNLALSEKRARHVAQKFAEAGIDSSHIKIAPRGQEMPVVKDGNRKQQAPNRRVEIFAIDSK
ncbi:MAG TPA: OmpA family protein [Candidatus Saccharimonadales bacterium]|nr:OmpA family protein [Candidatus Saccharimonadales bacterium]